MRRGRQKQFVFKMGSQHPNGGGPQRVRGVLAPTRGRAIMRFIHHQHVIASRIEGLAFGGQRFGKEPQRTFPFQEIQRGNQTREMCPGIGMNAPCPA